MDRLSSAERAVLEPVALDGLPVKDAAAVLKIRPTAAYVRLHRARKNMRDQLGDCDPVADDQPPAEDSETEPDIESTFETDDDGTHGRD